MEKEQLSILKGHGFPFVIAQYRDKWKILIAITINIMENFHLLTLLAPQPFK
ncbi:hypothetical protein [Desulfobacula phenolica]|uniref:hypothetical protein n=1 Tax=Desulfobacula phenolica TaxID=90732 RepID=UPI00158710A7|nr:hypothetical protein [Desulfobacula phenolica]